MKKNKIIYWALTGLVSLGFIMSSIMYLTQNAMLVENFQKIGFPLVMIQVLGVAKLLGGIAIINPWFPRLKEWAYAGFVFVLLGAVWVHIATDTAFVGPLVFLALVAGSYVYSNKVKVVS